MKSTELAAATQWITAAAVQHGPSLPAHVCDRLQISRRSAFALLRRLQSAQWLVHEGSVRRGSWHPDSGI